MSKLAVVFLLAAICCLVRCDFIEVVNSDVMLDKCSQEANVTSEDLVAFLNNEPAKTNSAKCVRACAFKYEGILSSNNQIDTEAAKKFLFTKIGQVEDKNLPDLEDCAQLELPDDGCEAAELYFLCVIQFVTNDKIA